MCSPRMAADEPQFFDRELIEEVVSITVQEISNPSHAHLSASASDLSTANLWPGAACSHSSPDWRRSPNHYRNHYRAALACSCQSQRTRVLLGVGLGLP